MVTKKQRTTRNHFRPLRIHRKRGIFRLSDNQIEYIALGIVREAEERVLNDTKNNG